MTELPVPTFDRGPLSLTYEAGKPIVEELPLATIEGTEEIEYIITPKLPEGLSYSFGGTPTTLTLEGMTAAVGPSTHQIICRVASDNSRFAILSLSLNITPATVALEQAKPPFRSIWQGATQAFNDDLDTIHDTEDEIEELETAIKEVELEKANTEARLNARIGQLKTDLNLKKAQRDTQIENSLDTLTALEAVQAKYRERFAPPTGQNG